ncbi:hypothetical protein C8Q80DRAFT_436740 [Daedaleopsis nitida]|nr:hypothetical protein C8Q80DRAFT_436740 [Daedaleopsis nitida]
MRIKHHKVLYALLVILEKSTSQCLHDGRRCQPMMSNLLTLAANSRLPFDIYQCFIDILRDNVPALSCCALVCHDWATRAQYHLFSHASLLSTSTGESVRRDQLEMILQDIPHIAQYIRSMTVSITTHEITHWSDFSRTLFNCARFPNLRSLTLKPFKIRYNSELTAIMRDIPTLLDLLLIDFEVGSHMVGPAPPTSTAPCHSLHSLRLNGHTVMNASNHSTIRLCTAMQQCGALAALSSLELLTQANICRLWISLLPDLGARLTHCAFQIFDPNERYGGPSTGKIFREHINRVCGALRFCPSLRSLRFLYTALHTFIQALHDNSGTDPTPRLSPFFFDTLADTHSHRRHPPLQHLKRLFLGFFCSVQSVSIDCSSACEPLSRALVSEVPFPFLNHLELDFTELHYQGKPPQTTLAERRLEACRMFAIVQDGGIELVATVKERPGPRIGHTHL